MDRPILTAAFAALGLHIQEAVTAMSQNDTRTRLADALNMAYKALSGSEYYYCYLVDVFGDDKAGDVIYSFRSELKRASYTCSETGATISIATAVDVVPLTTYEVKGSVQATEAGRRNSSRDLKQLQAIHDGAVGLGAVCAAKESALPVEGAVKLSEASAFPVDLALKEAFTAGHKIKLIAPGKGSTAYYTEEVLKRDGPIVFKAGTPMRIDHPTAQQEAERPEGSVKDWGAVLSQDAVWMDEGPAGKGLYSEVKPFSDHALTISEKGPYAGVSIAAWGEPEKANGKIVTREGVPVLARLTSADGVDMVTRAGAGGMFLTEASTRVGTGSTGSLTASVQRSTTIANFDEHGNLIYEAARSANPNDGGDPMDAAELKKLQESLYTQAAVNKKLLERALRGDAREYVVRALKGLTLHDAGKELVTESIMGREIPQADGVLDEAKLKEAVDAEAKRVGEAFAAAIGSGRVLGMGSAPVVEVPAKEAEALKAKQERRFKESVQAMIDMGMPEDQAKRAASRGQEAA